MNSYSHSLIVEFFLQTTGYRYDIKLERRAFLYAASCRISEKPIKTAARARFWRASQMRDYRAGPAGRETRRFDRPVPNGGNLCHFYADFFCLAHTDGLTAVHTNTNRYEWT